MRSARPAALAAALLIAGCGYFNAMYNAERRFGDAERARERGQRSIARAAYAEAIDKAAASYRGHPDGRWADDALYLIGRARFLIGEHEAAAAALRRVLERTGDDAMRGGAYAYLGAAHASLGDFPGALPPLDSAAALVEGDEMRAFVHLWRARARFETGNRDDALADLETAAAHGGPLAAEARLEGAARGLGAGDSARVREALRGAIELRDGGRWADSVGALATASAQRWGAAFGLGALPIERSAWPGAAADTLLLRRALLADEVGHRDAAIADAEAVGRGAGRGLADSALTLAARWRLEQTDDLAGLEQVRATLLPALGHTPARDLIHAIRTVDVLVGYARERGRPLALFAAAELARDGLRAPVLAAKLFIAYAELAPEAVWAPKALLAAAALADGEEADGLVAAAYAHATNPYVLAIAGTGDDPDAFASAEQRLSVSLGSLRADAAAEAQRADVGVARAVAVIDSLRAVARTDSLTLRCGSMMDTLGIFGVRADSARAACMRSDSARLAVVLTIDSTMLKDSASLARDSLRARLRQRGGRDTARDTFIR